MDLEVLNQEANKPKVRDLWAQGLFDGLDPEKDKELRVYQRDPVGFATEILGLTLTPAQQELLEAVRDYEVVQVKSATGVGKTFVLSVLAVWVYKCFDSPQVYTTSAPPESNLRKLLWGEIYTLANDNEILFQGDRIKASLHIDRHPKEFITGVSIPKDASDEDIETKWSGKHSPVLIFIFDEGDGIPDPVYKGADGCMSGGVFVRQVVCYNPKKKSGVAYERENEKRAYVISMSALDHPNVVSGTDEIPGAVTRNKTLLRINDWTEPRPLDMEIDSTCWKPPSFLVGKIAINEKGDEMPPIPPGWRVITDDQFYYKVLGEYPAGGPNQLIRDDWIDDAVARWELARMASGGSVKPPAGIRPIMGFDVSAGGPDYHAVGFRYGIWWDVPITWKDDDTDGANIQATKYYIQRDAKICKADGTGVGAATPGRMARTGRQDYSTRVISVPIMFGEKSTGFTDDGDFALIRDEAYWAVRTAFRKGQAAIPPDTHNDACKRMHKALRLATYDRDAKGRIKIMDKKTMIKLLGHSPDELEAYILTYAPNQTWIGQI